jgi:hypothetical protein
VLETHRPQERNKVQAFNDFLVFGMMALGSFSSGQLLAHYGWSMVNMVVFPAGAARPCGAVACVIRKAQGEAAGGWRDSRSGYLIFNLIAGGPMPTRARLDEFIAAVVSGDHAGAIERFYTEDASMQENAAAPRVGRDVLVAHERAVLERVKSVTSTCVASVVEGDRVAINWVFEFVYHSGKTGRFDEVALQEWRGDRVFRERFFYDPSKPAA